MDDVLYQLYLYASIIFYASEQTRWIIVNYSIGMRSGALLLLGLFLLAGLVSAQEGEDQQYLQMRRTACVILSRMHSNT